MESTDLFAAVAKMCETLTAGLSTRMDAMARQLESLPEIRERLGLIAAGQTEAAHKASEAKVAADKAHERVALVELTQAEQKGQIKMLTGMFICLGAPVIVILVAAGVAKLFGIDLGMG